MKLSSPSFADGSSIPKRFTCDDKGEIPPLVFSDVPKTAKSLALIIDDPDAPMGTWDHLLLFNIPPDAKGVQEGKNPSWPHGKNSWGKNSWGGPCPPDKEHRYYFKLYALDKTLELKEGADKKTLLSAMKGHVLEEAELMGKYKRPWM